MKHHEIKLDYHEDETTSLGTRWFRECLEVDGFRYSEDTFTYLRFSTRQRCVQNVMIHAFTRQLS